MPLNDEQPQHRFFLPDYFLAKTPVTHAQYKAFVRATGHEAPRAGPTELPHPLWRITRWYMSPGMTLGTIASGYHR